MGGKSAISVALFETEVEREARRASGRRRNRTVGFCLLCGNSRHSSRDCPLAPDDEDERVRLVKASEDLCWRCGQTGHQRAQCTSPQISSRPPRPAPPSMSIDIKEVAAAKSPFDAWVESLRCAVQGPDATTTLLAVPLA